MDTSSASSDRRCYSHRNSRARPLCVLATVVALLALSGCGGGGGGSTPSGGAGAGTGQPSGGSNGAPSGSDSAPAPVQDEPPIDGGSADGSIPPGDGTSDTDASPTPTREDLEWQTFQGNAAHTGHVDESYSPTDFEIAWQWQKPAGTRDWMNMVAAGGGLIYITEDAQYSSLYAVDEASGDLRWTTQFVNSLDTGGPAYSKGRIYVTTQSSDQAGGWQADVKVIDAATGELVFSHRVHSQMRKFFPVTPYGDDIYSSNDNPYPEDGQNGYSTELTSLSSGTPERNWIAYDAKSQSYTSQSVAVDSQHVYFYRSFSRYGQTNALVVLDRVTGELKHEIPGTRNKYVSYDFYGAPIISSPGHVLSFSDGQFLHSVSLEENLHHRALVRYDIDKGSISWTSTQEYLTAPASVGDLIFAASNVEGRMDAIEEKSGQVLWSWPAPSGEAFIRNVIASNNLVFVSTDRAVYAIDKQTRQKVWTHNEPGGLAIASGKYLLIASPSDRNNSPATVTAIRLK